MTIIYIETQGKRNPYYIQNVDLVPPDLIYCDYHGEQVPTAHFATLAEWEKIRSASRPTECHICGEVLYDGGKYQPTKWMAFVDSGGQTDLVAVVSAVYEKEAREKAGFLQPWSGYVVAIDNVVDMSLDELVAVQRAGISTVKMPESWNRS
jgi:hypothetical protein